MSKRQYTTVATYSSSSKSDKTYTVKLDEQGRVSCDCPVWVFNQKGDRTCYHTMAYVASCQGTFSAGPWQLGTVAPNVPADYPPVASSQDGDLPRDKTTGEPKRKLRMRGGDDS